MLLMGCRLLTPVHQHHHRLRFVRRIADTTADSIQMIHRAAVLAQIATAALTARRTAAAAAVTVSTACRHIIAGRRRGRRRLRLMVMMLTM